MHCWELNIPYIYNIYIWLEYSMLITCYYMLLHLLLISNLNGTPKHPHPPHTKISVPLSMRSRMIALGLRFVENSYDSNLKIT